MTSMAGVYGHRAWRKVRLEVLARDGHLCRIGGARCTLDATEVDHIISPRDGGSWFDPDNCRAACAWCNRSRGGKVGAAKTNARYAPDRVRSSREW